MTPKKDEYMRGYHDGFKDGAAELLAALKAMVLNDTNTYRDCHKAAVAAIAKAEAAS